MSGKGSKQRPRLVDQKTFEDNWDKIFGTKEDTKTDETKEEVLENKEDGI